MEQHGFKVGDKVWAKLPDGGGYAGEVVGFTPKRIKVLTEKHSEIVGNYKPENVTKRGGE